MALLTLLLMGLFAPANEFPPSHPATMKHFALLCNLYIECETVTKPPLVVFTDTGRALGYYFYDTDTVFITEECLLRMADVTKCSSIVLHEMAHYVAYHLVGMTGCESEDVAWTVSNNYARDQGREDLVNPDWRRTESRDRGRLQG
jgi:hypothetical protein